MINSCFHLLRVRRNYSKLTLLTACLFLFSSCLEKNLSYDYPEDTDHVRKARAGKFFKESDMIIYGKKTQKKPEEAIITKKNIQTENKLWNASLEVVSALLPIATMDATSQLITSEWHQNNPLNDNKRIKINLLVKGSELKEENLILSVFKQIKNQNGQWEDSDIDTSISNSIKEKIIEVATGIKKLQPLQINTPSPQKQENRIIYTLGQ